MSGGTPEWSGPSLSPVGRALRAFYYRIKPIRANAVTEWLRFRLGGRASPLVVHLGCGERRLAGAVNIDIRNTPAVDVVCDLLRLPYPTRSVDRIECYHVIEHLAHSRALLALARWASMLRDGGSLVIECPNFDEAARDYLAGNRARLGNIFGLQRFDSDFHLWGWSPSTLAAALREVGLVDVEERQPQDYHAQTEPCMRLEARVRLQTHE